MDLHNLKSSKKKSKRVGRGPGSGKGKTCGNGHKGGKARSGHGIRLGYEGGQARLFTKLPTYGFSNKRFKKPIFFINLSEIDRIYKDEEVVNFDSLKAKGKKPIKGRIKILANGDLNKKVCIEANYFSKKAIEKLNKKGIEYKILKNVK